MFNGEDCVAGYAAPTWDLFNDVYIEAGVAQTEAPGADGLDSSILEALAADDYVEQYSSNKWTGRVGL